MLLTGLYPSTQAPFMGYSAVEPNGDVRFPTIIADFKNNVFAKSSLSNPFLLYPTTFENIFNYRERASTATYYNEYGFIATASTNEIRKQTYDPSTSEITYNLIPYSENMAAGGWAVIRGTSETFVDEERGEYYKYTETPNLTGTFGIRSDYAQPHAGALSFVYSVAVKYVDAQYVGVGWKTTEWWYVNDGNFKIDLINGTIISAPLSAGNYGLIDEGNGWYRVWWTRTIAQSNNFRVVSVQVLDQSTLSSGTRTNGETGLSFLMSRPCADYGKTFKKYIKNDTANPVYELTKRAESTGVLLESSRTNLFSNSSALGSSPWQVWVGTLQSNALNILNPTNSGGCDSIISSGASARFSRVHTFPANTYVTVSIFMKPLSRDTPIFGIQFNNETAFPGRQGTTNFDTSTMTVTLATGVTSGGMQKLPNGWYRIWATNLTSATEAASDIRFYTNLTDSTANIVTCVYGAQAESGKYPTSYIPTPVGSTVTRANDNLHCEDMSLFNIAGATGTFFIEASGKNLNNDIAQTFVSLSDGTALNQIYIKTGGTNGVNKSRLIIVKDNVGILSTPNSSNSFVNGNNRLAFSYGTGAETGLNGVITVNATATIVPPNNSNILKVASNPTGAERAHININSFVYYPVALSTQSLQTKTTL